MFEVIKGIECENWEEHLFTYQMLGVSCDWEARIQPGARPLPLDWEARIQPGVQNISFKALKMKWNVLGKLI